MPARITPLVNGEFYHLYNRGVAHQPIFLTTRDYQKFLLSLRYYQFQTPPVKLSRLMQLPKDEKEYLLKELETKGKKLVNLVCFVLMPNHFHLLTQQLIDNGISTFVQRTTDSYVRYFNTKHERVGPLFQGTFKAVRITTTEQLLHASRYIHLNPLVSFVVREKNFIQYQWSSLQYFLQENVFQNIVNSSPILQNFKSKEEYKKFVLDQAKYAKELEKIKHMVID